MKVQQIINTAKAKNRAIVAFNASNLELVQAITEAANELHCPIFLQASQGAIKYSGMKYLTALVNAARESVKIPIILHLDHGETFESCKQAIDNGFDSVMIDASHKSFQENITLTKQVVDYAHKHGVWVEAELGVLAGIEDNISSDKSLYTDPAQAKEFIEKTGVNALAISIGTAHGAFKYKSDPKLRLDILESIHKLIPDTPLVLHGASSVTQSDVATINKYNGEIKNALGVSESVLAETLKFGVRKINIDSDLRLAFTAALREYLHLHPSHFDPRQYLGAARLHVKELVKKKLHSFSL